MYRRDAPQTAYCFERHAFPQFDSHAILTFLNTSDLFDKCFATTYTKRIPFYFENRTRVKPLTFTSPIVSILRKRKIETIQCAQIKFFSLTATQILSAGPMFKNAIAVTENRELRAFRRCIDRSILLLMGVPRPEGQRVVSRFENQRNRRREEGLNPAAPGFWQFSPRACLHT